MARAAELELVFSGTPLAGSAARIAAAREAGPFLSMEDAARRAGLDDAGVKALSSIQAQARKIGPAIRR
jgi:DNA polymerase III alpha subunit (gram-positive type)